MSIRRLPPWLLVAAVAAGCVRGPVPTTPKKPAPTGPVATAGANIVAQGGNLISNNGGNTEPGNPLGIGANVSPAPVVPILANNGAGLKGVALAPAGIVANNGAGILANNGSNLISDHGAGIISEHGAGVIANNGAGYKLLAEAAQVPVANALVAMLDAAGHPFVRADGTPITVRTDAQGRYAFPDAPPNQPVVVVVGLAGGGELHGLAPHPDTAKQVDLDLVGTLTSDYILDQYVAWQADPKAVLAKLPSDVEAATRAKAGAAFTAAKAQAPGRLDPRDSVRTVAQLRRADAAFDGQLEAVKQLLVAAGQSNLGEGRPGTEVRLGFTGTMGFAPDGALYFATPYEGRIWRLGADGRLKTLAGSGSADHGDLTGKPGPQAGLDFLRGFAFDRAGRMLIVETNSYHRLTRLEADGTIRQLWHPTTGTIHAAVPGPDGSIVVVYDDKIGTMPATGGPPTPVKTIGAPEAAWVSSTLAFGADDQGRILLGVTAGDRPAILRVDPKANYAITKLPGVTAFDTAGHVFGDADGPIKLLDDPTAPQTLATTVPPGFLPLQFTSYALAPDGKPWLAGTDGTGFYLYNGLERVAGMVAAAGATAGDLALSEPGGILPTADGGFVVADRAGNKIYRVAADGKATSIAGNGTPQSAGDGGQAVDALVNQPTGVLGDAAGNLYVVEGTFFPATTVRKISPDGKIALYATLGHPDGLLKEEAMAPDGTLYFVFSDTNGATVYQLAPGTSTPKALFETHAKDGQHHIMSLAIGPDGTLWYTADSSIGSWTEAEGPKVRVHDEAFHYAEYGGLAVDARGRCYVTNYGQSKITRWDPTTGAIKPIAGAGAPLLAGTGTDDGLKLPTHLAFDAHGDLLIADTGHKQVKRLPAAKLP